MVKYTKKRVMITLTNNLIKELDNLCEAYGMNKSQLISMLLVFHKERMNK